MSESQFKHRQGAFKPINTLSSLQSPKFHATATGITIMVNEREPPRLPNSLQTPPQSSVREREEPPQFGQSSPLRNPLKSNASHVFNIPRPSHARPEHHRPMQRMATVPHPSRFPASQDAAASQVESVSNPQNSSPDCVEIPKPTNMAHPTIYPALRPIYSTANAFRPVNAFKTADAAIINLTERAADDEFNPNRADNGGSFDPSNFMDAAKANKSIKALLEGAFEDQDDKPRTRLRRKKKEASVECSLSEQLERVTVNGGEGSTPDAEDVEEDDGVVEGLNVKLLPHQIDGLSWMIDKEIGMRKKNGVLPKGGILADDMGLGKTIQALALILSNRRPSSDDLRENPKLKIPDVASKTTLVVAPLALIKQWESEIKTKVDTFPRLKVLVHHGQSRTKSFEDLKKQDVVITTYQTLSSEHAASSKEASGLKSGCFGVYWYRVILDEAHSIKNRSAKMTRAAYDLESVYRWCMTGTPMQNNLDELQSLIRFLRIKPYNDLGSWREQIAQPMRNGRGGLAMKRLQYFLKAFMKRRTKDVLKKEGGLRFGKSNATSAKADQGGFHIVKRDVKTVVAHFDKSERIFYESLAGRAERNLEAIMGGEKQDYIGALVLLLRLRQACNHPGLSRHNLRKERECFPGYTQGSFASNTSGKANCKVTGVDDVADMLGTLTVNTQKCDSCGSKLRQPEMDSGAIRCDACEEDFRALRDNSVTRHHRSPRTIPKSQRRDLHTRRITDSDDEDGSLENDNSALESKAVFQVSTVEDEELGEHLNAECEPNDSVIVVEETKKSQLYGVESTANGDDNSNAPDNFEIDIDSGDEDESEEEEDESATVFERGPPSSTKIRKLIQILNKECHKHKFIVFSEFTSMLDLIEPFLHQAGLRYARYDGKMRNDAREASLEKLRDDRNTRILLCSLRCGSLGLNLTAASRVVIMEPFWNPFVEEQAIDRVHRLNQSQDVVVYRLTIADSVEEKILDLQEKKRELANAAIEGGKSIAKLSMRDIMDLFKRDAEHRHENDNVRIPFWTAGPQTETPPSTSFSTASKPMAPITQQALNRERAKGKSKFHIHASLRPEYESLYARRW